MRGFTAMFPQTNDYYMPHPKVTVAITVHNREQYIEQCLDSIVAQTLCDMEIVCVDDASTDRSFEILQRYANNDNRIRLHRFTKNSGVQMARNYAIETARGEFITFVDDDDWISNDCMEECIKCFTENPEVDCVLIPEIRLRPDGTMFAPANRREFLKITGEEAFLLSMPWQVAGNFCVRTSFHKLCPFDNSCRYFGDENTGRLMLLSAKCVMMSNGTYYYRMTEQSVCHSIGIGQYSRLNAQRSLAEKLCRKDTKRELRQAYETFCWENVVSAYMRYYKERKFMDKALRAQATGLIKQALRRMDFNLVNQRLQRKFGYIPFTSSWLLFKLQEELYFFLRTIIGRMDNDDTGDPLKTMDKTTAI